MFVRQTTYDKLLEENKKLKSVILDKDSELEQAKIELEKANATISGLRDVENPQITFVFKGDNYDEVKPIYKHHEDFANFLDINAEISDPSDPNSIGLAMIARVNEVTEQIITDYAPVVKD